MSGAVHMFVASTPRQSLAYSRSMSTSACMPKPIDITGRRFGRLTVQHEVAKTDPHGRRRRWRVTCDCGVEKDVDGISLLSGNTTSCGCRKRENLLASSLRHGQARHGACTPEYKTWASMNRRCHTPSASGYAKYGARGVTVCAEWRASFEAFLSHVGPRPSSEHSIDRIDNACGYEPGNVRWATRTEQARNKTTNRRLTIAGETLPVSAWAERSGLDARLIIIRLSRGWTPEDAVFRPTKEYA